MVTLSGTMSFSSSIPIGNKNKKINSEQCSDMGGRVHLPKIDQDQCKLHNVTNLKHPQFQEKNVPSKLTGLSVETKRLRDLVQ